jgi:hypothetical protein
MARRLSDLSEAVVIAPLQTGSVTLDDLGHGIRSVDADALVEQVVDSMSRGGAGTLVVEDDLARQGDAALPVDVAYVGDRVLRWAALTPGDRLGWRLLRTGSSGYPLNAFVCRSGPADLPLSPGRELSESDTAALADTACAVITSVYDAESFLVLGEAGLGNITT